jgi:hypothetical protein
MPDSFWIQLVNAALSLAVATITLGLGWLVGQRLTYRWNIRQKRREAQMSIAQQFYSAYGEFFALWKLWNRLDPDAASFEERRWELHKRAAAAEACIESILVKLSSELRLDQDQIATLGCFRQGFQTIRQVIQTGVHLPWSFSEHPQYAAFKTLASRMGTLLASNWPEQLPTTELAASQFRRITANYWEEVWTNTSMPTAGTETAMTDR